MLTSFISKSKPLLITTAAFLLVLSGIWLFIAVTRIGVTPDIAYWNEAGVPLLGLQILFALAVSLGLDFVISRISIKKIRIAELALVLSIWALAAGVWLAEPQGQSVNAPRPLPPAYEYYPLLDSTSYDLGSQYALIGQGLNNDLLTDKPLYMFFLTLLHLVSGQSVRVVTGLQVIVLALFPVMLFLLGREIQGRGAGILVALLAIFKERNAIAAVLDIQVSHVKLMMTEVPTALLISVVTLLLVKWAKRDSLSAGSLPLWVGGTIGAAVLMRANVFTLLPLALLIPFLARERSEWNWRQALLSAASVLFAFSLVVLPWLLLTRDNNGRTYLQVKLNGVLERYRPVAPSGSGWSPSRGPQFAMLDSSGALPNYREASPWDQSPIPNTDETSPLIFIPAHFFHNQVAAIFILPTTLRFYDLPRMLESPLWDKNWSGDLTLENGAMLLLNLGLLALGLSLAWRRWRLAGLIPALVEILYFLANALARTSGSRYLVPADWVIYFYYALGLIQLAEWTLELVARREFSPNESTPDTSTSLREASPRDSASLLPAASPRGWIAPVVSLLVLGMVMPLSAPLIPDRYPALNKHESYKVFAQQVSLTELGYTRQDINAFLKHPDSVIFQARLLYPRYLLADDGLCKKCFVLDAAFGIREYPRLSFVALGPFSAGVILEMEDLPANFRSLDLSNAPDVWVVGCREHEEVISLFKGFHSSVRGLVVAINGKRGLQVYAPPNQRLTCE